MPTHSLLQLAFVLCMIVAIVMSVVRGEYKASGAWFYTCFALAAAMLVLGH